MEASRTNQDINTAHLIKCFNPVLLNRESLSRHRFKIRKSETSTFFKSNRSLLTEDARAGMKNGGIPSLEPVCDQLTDTFTNGNYPFNALQFIPVLRLTALNIKEEIERFLVNPITKHVLVQNDLIKIVLIHWKPGDYSAVHGHAAGGCVFKVLYGSVEEKRYGTESNPALLGISQFNEGGMAYIDDTMAFHAVGNPFHESAISIHVYTPGFYSTNDHAGDQSFN